MNNLEKAHLKCICDKYDIDYCEIDSSLTYWENKEHIMGIVKMLRRSDCFELSRMEALQAQFAHDDVLCWLEQYLKEHFLSYFIMCQLYNETTPADVGKVPELPLKFSLAEFVKQQE